VITISLLLLLLQLVFLAKGGGNMDIHITIASHVIGIIGLVSVVLSVIRVAYLLNKDN
jgi:hypothetical protein